MAMNKKEQKLVEDLQIIAALKWTDDVVKDIPVPYSSSTLVVGYTYDQYSKTVSGSCSTSSSHSIHSVSETSSQGGIQMFSTKAKAFKAMRHAVCVKVAQELRYIDKLIEEDCQAT